MKSDMNICKSLNAKMTIQLQIDEFEKQLKLYKKPILIDPPYDDNSIFKLRYVDFSDEELEDEAWRMEYLNELAMIIAVSNQVALNRRNFINERIR